MSSGFPSLRPHLLHSHHGAASNLKNTPFLLIFVIRILLLSILQVYCFLYQMHHHFFQCIQTTFYGLFTKHIFDPQNWNGRSSSVILFWGDLWGYGTIPYHHFWPYGPPLLSLGCEETSCFNRLEIITTAKMSTRFHWSLRNLQVFTGVPKFSDRFSRT